MKVLIDTSVLSLAFRKQSDKEVDLRIIKEIIELIREFRAVIIGPIRQEILSGLADEKKFEVIKEKLEILEDSKITTEMYEEAARMSNVCRKQGIQGSSIDFLICAFSSMNNISIFTLDKDFDHYAKIIPIKLHKVRTEFLD